MTDDDDREFVGPIEQGPWPRTIPGYVVRPGPWPELHGYDVYRDLARHYRYGEMLLTALRGEVPDEDDGVAFEVAMTFLAPCSIAEAPAHAARIAATVGARPASVASTAAITAAEEAQFMVRASGPVLAWLRDPSGPCPALPRPPAEDDTLDALRTALPASFRVVLPSAVELDLVTACLAVLTRCGLDSDVALIHAMMLARLPVALAESRHLGRRFRDYPMDRPRFRYVEDER